MHRNSSSTTFPGEWLPNLFADSILFFSPFGVATPLSSRFRLLFPVRNSPPPPLLATLVFTSLSLCFISLAQFVIANAVRFLLLCDLGRECSCLRCFSSARFLLGVSALGFTGLVRYLSGRHRYLVAADVALLVAPQATTPVAHPRDQKLHPSVQPSDGGRQMLSSHRCPRSHRVCVL